MKVKCLDVEYREGDFDLVQGIKKGSPERYDQSGHFENRGHGWGQNTIKSDLLLTIEGDEIVNGVNFVSLGDFFKRVWGRLTVLRQNALINTMPEFIEVKVNKYSSGKIYYEASSTDLSRWLESAKADQVRRKKNLANMKKEIAANKARKIKASRQQSFFGDSE